MRIIVRYCLPWGNFSTQAIDIEPNATVETLQAKIFEKFNIPIRRQLIKFKRDGFSLRVVNGWTLDFYEIHERAILYLDTIDNLNKDDENQAFENIRMTGKYYARLGILSTVKDEDEDDEDAKPRNPMKFGSGQVSNANSDDEDDDGDVKKRKKSSPDDGIEAFLKEIKSGNMESILSIYQNIREDSSHPNPEEKIKHMINHNGSGGWNALHFAIYLAHQNVVKDLLDRGANVNKVTADGWTPLQLSAHRNNIDIGRMLLKVPGIEINTVTAKSTALHIAAQHGRLAFVHLLLSAAPDMSIKNEEGMTAFEIASTEEIRRAMEVESLRQSQIRDTLTDEFHPPKPPIIKGWLFKLGALVVNVRKRYVVINPDQGTFMRFKEIADYPNKPVEIIPLNQITNVKRIPNSWLFKKHLYHFEVTYSSRIILAAQSAAVATQWVTYLYQAVVYANWIDQKIKEDVNKIERSDFTEIKLASDISHKPNDVVVIEDYEETKEQRDQKSSTQKKPITQVSTDTSSDKGTSPELSPTSSKSPKPNSVDRNRAVTDFRMNIEENKKEQNLKADFARNNSMIPSSEMKLDDTINFNSFEILKMLGSGAFGKVYKVKKRDDGKIYAMKALKKRNLIMKNQLKYAITEANVLRTANHPFILSLHYAFQTPQYLYMVLDFCPGGDLALHLAQKGKFDENEAKFYVAELLVAIDHLHSMNVLYRDLKPENILIGEDGHIKLADFGLSKEGVTDEGNAKSFCGSPAYLSPEMLKNRGVGKAADVYGIGAVLYEMLCGNSPYYCDDIPKMYSNIRKGKLTFPKNISENAKNLILKLLNRDPNQRIGVKDKSEVKKDPFFKDIDWDRLLKKEIPPPVLDTFSGDESEDENPKGVKPVHTDFDYDEKNKKANRVTGFTFIKNNS